MYNPDALITFTIYFIAICGVICIAAVLYLKDKK